MNPGQWSRLNDSDKDGNLRYIFASNVEEETRTFLKNKITGTIPTQPKRKLRSAKKVKDTKRAWKRRRRDEVRAVTKPKWVARRKKELEEAALLRERESEEDDLLATQRDQD